MIDAQLPEGWQYRSVLDYWRARISQHTDDIYRGRVLQKFPEDLRTYQRIIEECQPDIILELGSYDGGSALWFADQLRALCGGGHVLSVDSRKSCPSGSFPEDPDVTFMVGDLTSQVTVDAVGEWLWERYGEAEIMVVEDSAHDYGTTLEALTLYSGWVSSGQWFVVEDGIVDEPSLRVDEHGEVRYWPTGVQNAVAEFLSNTIEGERFTQHWIAPYGLTTNHGGWLCCAD